MPRVILAALSNLTDTYSHIYSTKDGKVAFADTIIMSIHDFSVYHPDSSGRSKERYDLIEHQLAHTVRDPNGRTYNRT